jgi:hypothetical protein
MGGPAQEFELSPTSNIWRMVPTLVLLWSAAVSAAGEPNSAQRWAVTVTAGTTEIIDVAKASEPRLLTIDEGDTDLEILSTSGHETPLSIDNGVGRRSPRSGYTWHRAETTKSNFSTGTGQVAIPPLTWPSKP